MYICVRTYSYLSLLNFVGMLTLYTIAGITIRLYVANTDTRWLVLGLMLYAAGTVHMASWMMRSGVSLAPLMMASTLTQIIFIAVFEYIAFAQRPPFLGMAFGIISIVAMFATATQSSH